MTSGSLAEPRYSAANIRRLGRALTLLRNNRQPCEARGGFRATTGSAGFETSPPRHSGHIVSPVVCPMGKQHRNTEYTVCIAHDE